MISLQLDILMIIIPFNKSIPKKILPVILLMLAFPVFGQDTLTPARVYPAGIFAKYGMGRYSVKDQYISSEKYSGWLPYYSFGWRRSHDRYVYRLELTYRYSDKIKNNNIPAEITQFELKQGFLYPLKKASLWKKDLYFWIGPSTDLFYFNNKPRIAVSGFDYAQSIAGLISLGFSAELIYPLTHHFQVESSLDLSVLSLGLRTVDLEEDDESSAKLLTLFTGLNSSFNFGVRYFIIKKLSLNLAYRFELTRISAWEPLLSASNNLLIGINYRF